MACVCHSFDSCFSKWTCVSVSTTRPFARAFKTVGFYCSFLRVGSTGRRRMMTATAVAAAEEAWPRDSICIRSRSTLSVSHTHNHLSLSLSRGLREVSDPCWSQQQFGHPNTVFHRSIYARLGLTPFLGRNNKKKKKRIERFTLSRVCLLIFFSQASINNRLLEKLLRVFNFWLDIVFPIKAMLFTVPMNPRPIGVSNYGPAADRYSLIQSQPSS